MTATPLVDRAVVDIVTVAYENPDVVRWQQELLAVNLRDAYRHTVLDNSPNASTRERICDDAATRGTGYVDISTLTHGVSSGSVSHGIAMNWAWYQFLRLREAEVVAFLDHDVYPVVPTSLRARLGSTGVFGDIQRKSGRWYLWAGLCCFRRDRLEGLRVDFRPEHGVSDTGGRNATTVFATIDAEQVEQPRHEYGQLRHGDDPQGDYYEVIGDWLHSINGSNWKPVPDRARLVEDLVRRHLK